MLLKNGTQSYSLCLEWERNLFQALPRQIGGGEREKMWEQQNKFRTPVSGFLPFLPFCLVTLAGAR